MSINKPQKTYQKQFNEAIADFWGVRTEQSEKQQAEGKPDAGTRGTVTGGKHFDSLEKLVCSILAENGFDQSTTTLGKKATLPGYFREQKNWDIVVQHGDNVVATIEMKSQSRSFGNNLNNRIEEAIGQTVDFWKAHESELVPGMRPWFGYIMIVEDHPDSSKPVGKTADKYTALFKPDPVFERQSYIERYSTAFDRLVTERNLDAACFAVSEKGSTTANFPSQAMSFDYFALTLANRCQQALAALGPLPGRLDI